MDVILLESLNKLGGIGDLVTVKDGYARNYLIPQKKALRANDENKEYFSKIKKDLVEKNKKIIEDAKLTVQKISKLEVIFIRNASDNGQLYGSVSPKDVSNYFTEKKISIKPSHVNFHDAIKKMRIRLPTPAEKIIAVVGQLRVVPWVTGAVAHRIVEEWA